MPEARRCANLARIVQDPDAGTSSDIAKLFYEHPHLLRMLISLLGTMNGAGAFVPGSDKPAFDCA
jgi:hypothetical protein